MIILNKFPSSCSHLVPSWLMLIPPINAFVFYSIFSHIWKLAAFMYLIVWCPSNMAPKGKRKEGKEKECCQLVFRPPLRWQLLSNKEIITSKGMLITGFLMFLRVLYFVEKMVLLLACGIMRKRLPCHRFYRNVAMYLCPHAVIYSRRLELCSEAMIGPAGICLMSFWTFGRIVGLFGTNDWRMILNYVYVYW